MIYIIYFFAWFTLRGCNMHEIRKGSLCIVFNCANRGQFSLFKSFIDSSLFFTRVKNYILTGAFDTCYRNQK